MWISSIGLPYFFVQRGNLYAVELIRNTSISTCHKNRTSVIAGRYLVSEQVVLIVSVSIVEAHKTWYIGHT